MWLDLVLPNRVTVLDLSDWLGIWGAGLATLHAIYRLVEWWRDRRRIAIYDSFNSDYRTGNTITISNLSNVPLLIDHWWLFRSKGFWGFKRKTSICEIDHDAVGFSVPPYSRVSLPFCDSEYFDWGPTVYKKKGRLKLRLDISGRLRPVFVKLRRDV